MQGNAIQQLWRIAEEVSVELVTLKKKLQKSEEDLNFARKGLKQKEKDLLDLQTKYENSGFFTNIKNSITGVCKRRNNKDKRGYGSGNDENPMSMFHDEIEDL
jgi:predicted  nucleic acid-binding Zn-ribbon protein